jgi:hypothetical protein
LRYLWKAIKSAFTKTLSVFCGPANNKGKPLQLLAYNWYSSLTLSCHSAITQAFQSGVPVAVAIIQPLVSAGT